MGGLSGGGRVMFLGCSPFLAKGGMTSGTIGNMVHVLLKQLHSKLIGECAVKLYTVS